MRTMFQIKQYQNELYTISDLQDGTMFMIERADLENLLTIFQYRKFLRGVTDFQLNYDKIDVSNLISIGSVIE